MNIDLNVQDWKEFKVRDLFSNIYKAKAHTKEEVIEAENGLHFVSRTDMNNGIDIVVKKEDLDGIEQGNCITIGDTTATCYYQNKEFVAGDHMVVMRAKWLNALRGLFVKTLITQEQYRYCYGRAYKMDLIKDTTLKLPIQRDDNGQPIIDENHTYSEKGYIPDWEFMEDYIKSLNYKPITTVVKTSEHPTLDVEKWEEFILSDLFKIKKGKRLTSADQEEGINNYVGAIDSNNGIANHIGQAPIHKGNTISLSYNGSVGEAFYQKDDYWATDDVNALYCKYKGFNCKIGLFIATVIRQEKYKFTYGRKWTLDNMNKTVIKLPIQRDDNGQPILDKKCKYSDDGYIPDWEFMEQYIESLPYSDRI